MRFLRLSINSPPRFSGLCFFVSAYIGLFVIAGVILFGSLSSIRRSNFKIPTGHCNDHGIKVANRFARDCISLDTASQVSKKSHKNIDKYISNGKTGSIFSRSFLEVNWPLSHSTLINCSSMKEISNMEFIAAGWTKAVYKGIFRGQKVAIKTARHDGYDIQDCLKNVGTSLTTCFQRLDAKIIKEIILLSEIPHENVVKMLGYCIPDADGFASLVTELGDTLDTVRLLQISWEDRLRLVLGIAHILQHFAQSPLGSLSMNDFRREQFVIVDGILKISDLDDVGIGEPECVNDDTCQNLANFSIEDLDVNNNIRMSPCVNFRCIGHNSRINIWNAGQHFVKLLLPIGSPEPLQPYIEDLLSAYELEGSSNVIKDVSNILDSTHRLINHYTSGKYIHAAGGVEKLGFKKIENSDLPGKFDYRCRYSISAVSCVISVFNEEEAAQFCNKDIECKAVVLSKLQTWTGRIIAIFKNGFGSPIVGSGYTLLLKLNPT